MKTKKKSRISAKRRMTSAYDDILFAAFLLRQALEHKNLNDARNNVSVALQALMVGGDKMEKGLGR